MSLDGRVRIDLVCDGGRVVEASVVPPHPVALTSIVRGRPAAGVVAAIGSLFSVCGMAQSAASVEAVEAVLSIRTDRRTKQARWLLVLAETLREHLLRIGLDIAAFAEEAADRNALRRAMSLPLHLKQALFPGDNAFIPGARAGLPAAGAVEVAAEASDLVRTMVYAGEEPLGEKDPDAFAAWAMEGGTVAARLVAPVLARGWAMVGCPRAAKPGERDLWDGVPADTSCLARQAGEPLVRAFLSPNGEAGLAARLAARFIEASKLPGQIAEGLAALRNTAEEDDTVAQKIVWDVSGSRTATGIIEAARGRLEHRIMLNDGHVADYVITAPTGVHFGRGGVAARSLCALAASRQEDIPIQVDLLVRAIDPCVGYDVRFR